jgi:hypothetical protein
VAEIRSRTSSFTGPLTLCALADGPFLEPFCTARLAERRRLSTGETAPCQFRPCEGLAVFLPRSNAGESRARFWLPRRPLVLTSIFAWRGLSHISN